MGAAEPPSFVEAEASSPPAPLALGLAGVEGTLEKADGAAEKALNADALPGLLADAKPLVDEKAEKGDAAARLVVGAALVNGVVGRSPAGLAWDDLASSLFDVDAAGVAGGPAVERKEEAENADLALGFCPSAAPGLVGVETDASGEAEEANAEKGEAADE